MKVVFLGLLLPMAMLLSACGEGGSVVTTTTAPPTTTTTSETTTTVEITTIETTTTATRTTSTVTVRTTLSKCKDTTTPKFTTTTTAAPPTTTTTGTTLTTITVATIATTTTVEPVAVVTTTTPAKMIPSTRPATTQPGYVPPVVPVPFNEEELRTDLRLVLTIVPYGKGKEMNIQFVNLTDDVATIDMARAVLKKDKNGNWKYVYTKETVAPRYIKVGGTYETSLSFKMNGGPYRWMKLTEEELEPGEYKLIWAVEGGWIGADFTVE